MILKGDENLFIDQLVAALGHQVPAMEETERRRLATEFMDGLGRILETVHGGPADVKVARLASLCTAAQMADVETLTQEEQIVCMTLIEACRLIRVEAQKATRVTEA